MRMTKDLVKKNPDLGILLVRIALGVGFMAHGISKFQNLEGTMKFFSSQGIPSAMAYLVAAVETLGGLAMILGYCTQVAGILLAVVMLVAVVAVKADKSLAIMNIELELTYLLASLSIVFAGPGKYSLLDMFSKKPSPTPGQQL